jgi:hypothetical protein
MPRSSSPMMLVTAFCSKDNTIAFNMAGLTP